MDLRPLSKATGTQENEWTETFDYVHHWSGIRFSRFYHMDNDDEKMGLALAKVLPAYLATLTPQEVARRLRIFEDFREAETFRVTFHEWLREKVRPFGEGCDERVRKYLKNPEAGVFLSSDNCTDQVPESIRARLRVIERAVQEREALHVTALFSKRTEVTITCEIQDKTK